MKKEAPLKYKQEKKAYQYEDYVGYQVFMSFQVTIYIDIAHGLVETNLSLYIYSYISVGDLPKCFLKIVLKYPGLVNPHSSLTSVTE